MIISLRHRFIFLHGPKTAGSSINVALAPDLGPWDLVLGAKRERAAAGIRPNPRARLDAACRLKGLVANLGGPPADARVLKAQDARYRSRFAPQADHPTAAQVRDLDPRRWASSFVFSFVRNPYERLVSMYLYLRRKGQAPASFASFVGQLTEGDGDDRLKLWRRHVDQWPIHAIDDRVAVDFVGRYERLGADFAEACRRAGLPERPLPRTKSSGRYDFRDFYDPATRRRVERACAREIDAFGYRFHEHDAAIAA